VSRPPPPPRISTIFSRTRICRPPGDCRGKRLVGVGDRGRQKLHAVTREIEPKRRHRGNFASSPSPNPCPVPPDGPMPRPGIEEANPSARVSREGAAFRHRQVVSATIGHRPDSTRSMGGQVEQSCHPAPGIGRFACRNVPAAGGPTGRRRAGVRLAGRPAVSRSRTRKPVTFPSCTAAPSGWRQRCGIR
jgi:hypothetical protein